MLVRAALAKDPAGRPTATQVRQELLPGESTASDPSAEVTRLLERTWSVPAALVPTSTNATAWHPRIARWVGASIIVLALAVATVMLVTRSGAHDPTANGDTVETQSTSIVDSPVVSTTTPTTAATTAAPPTTAPPTIRSVDFNNRTYQLECGEGAPEPVSVVNGRWQRDADPTNGALDGLDVRFADITPDPGEEAVVGVGCAFGAHTVIHHVIVFRVASDGSAAQVGPDDLRIPTGPLA
jgi:hypothetical protein